EDINLILMSIRILKNFSPFVRFFLCIKDARHNYRLDTAMIPTKPENSDNTISIKEFYKVEDYYNSLLNLRSISTRTHNAVFFLYKAFHAIHWVDAYLFYMLAIEALFSKDEGGSAKKTFIDRTHCFLAKEIIPHDKDLLEKVYKLRSFIVHGKPISRSKPDQNIAELLQVENLAIAVFKKILDQKLADRFKDSERDRFLNGAVASKKNNDRTNHRTLLLKE
ncbi:MAG TPA: HEPN domain-containing protein, partial [bacterium]|nr:HEPN domain-containing protein [bacterium]